MILYLTIIFCAMLVIAGAVALAYSVGFFGVFGYTAFAVVLVMLIDAVVATAARLLPVKCANHDKKIFKVSPKEKKFYEKLKIRAWKDKVPEIGQLTGFRKNKLDSPQSVEYLDRFLLESCYGEIGHFCSVILGFLLVLPYGITPMWFAISIPVAFVNALMNIPSFCILRYNSYKLEVLKKSIVKKQARQQKRQEDAITDEAN
ncbi:MAG: hypothetical protein IKB20_05070 [Clostridia bacterium]|nr:hypothetical protein [Clostridia bacterium]